jgi:hypothetical protein
MIGVGISAGLSGSKRARTIQDPLPALDLDWATDRSLPAAYGPTPSFSRASVGTYFNSSGVLTSAAVNVPRFNHVYSGGSWVSRGLLVEEQKTNITNWSEDFSNAYWGKSNASVTANAATAPDGNATADKFVENTSSSGHVVGRNIGTTSGTQAWSFYAKKAERSWICVNAYVGADARTWFNLDNGTVGTNAAGSTAAIQSVGNGWYRCSVTRTGGANTYFDIHIANADNTFIYTGDGTSGVFVWGAQLESGSFATSYIPTTTASVTRSADVCQITGTSFSSFWNASEGSVAVEYIQHKPLNIGTVVSFSDGGTSNVLYDYASEGTSGGTDYGPSFYIRSGGTFTVENNNSPIGSGLQKYAVAFKSNDFAMSYLGASAKTDSTVTLPTVTQLGIGKPLFAQYPFSGHISRLRYYPTRLSNAQLQSLST